MALSIPTFGTKVSLYQFNYTKNIRRFLIFSPDEVELRTSKASHKTMPPSKIGIPEFREKIRKLQ